MRTSALVNVDLPDLTNIRHFAAALRLAPHSPGVRVHPITIGREQRCDPPAHVEMLASSRSSPGYFLFEFGDQITDSFAVRLARNLSPVL
jgi:hypothetical protein